MKNKKGDLTSKQLVMIIALILGFGLVLLFLWRMNMTGEINKETCHQSVLTRATFNAGVIEAGKKTIPLNCKVEKICLTQSGDSCDSQSLFSTSDNKVVNIRLSKDKEKAKQEIFEVFANELYDCHSMLGEGKLDFMPTSFSNSKYCFMCARIAMDEEAVKMFSDSEGKIDSFSLKEWYSYLARKLTPGKQTYLEYIYGFESYQEAIEETQKIIEEYNKGKDADERRNIDDLRYGLGYPTGYGISAEIITKGASVRWGEFLVPYMLQGTFKPLILFDFSGEKTRTGIRKYITRTSEAKENIYSYNPPKIIHYDSGVLNALGCSSIESTA
jgi:hypothetical protein